MAVTMKSNILSRVCVATIKDEYWIDNWIYWITHSYSVYTLHSQFTIVLAESSYCVFTGCPSSNTVESVHLQLFSEDCCFTVDSRLGNSTPSSQLTALPLGWITGWLIRIPRLTDARPEY
jgi:hypothetical protein